MEPNFNKKEYMKVMSTVIGKVEVLREKAFTASVYLEKDLQKESEVFLQEFHRLLNDLSRELHEFYQKEEFDKQSKVKL